MERINYVTVTVTVCSLRADEVLFLALSTLRGRMKASASLSFFYTVDSNVYDSHTRISFFFNLS